MQEIKPVGNRTEEALPFEGSIIMRPEEKPRVLAAPVSKENRIQTIDIIRGFALCGILLMNIPGFGIDRSVFDKVLLAPTRDADYYTMAVIFTLFEGTMRGLFSMLFGAGMILFLMNKMDDKGSLRVAEVYYRRLLWLTLFGMINAYILLWRGDILFYYGLTGMLLYPLRKINPRWLLLMGICCFLITAYKQMASYDEMRDKRAKYNAAVVAERSNAALTDEQNGDKAAWQEIEKNQRSDPDNSARNIRKMRSGYGVIFDYFIPQNSDGEAWGTYHFIWDMLGMMLIGMGLFKLGFFSNKRSTTTYALGLLVGYGIGIPMGWIYFKYGAEAPFLNIGQYVDSYTVPHWLVYDIKRIFLCLGHASIIMLVYRSRIIPWLMNGFGNVGQMAFTNYLMQSLICTFFFFGYGFGYYDKLRFHELYYVVGAVWVFQLIFSAIWLRYFRFGPLEWVWRSLTYWKMQPMKIKR